MPSSCTRLPVVTIPNPLKHPIGIAAGATAFSPSPQIIAAKASTALSTSLWNDPSMNMTRAPTRRISRACLRTSLHLPPSVSPRNAPRYMTALLPRATANLAPMSPAYASSDVRMATRVHASVLARTATAAALFTLLGFVRTNHGNLSLLVSWAEDAP